MIHQILISNFYRNHSKDVAFVLDALSTQKLPPRNQIWKLSENAESPLFLKQLQTLPLFPLGSSSRSPCLSIMLTAVSVQVVIVRLGREMARLRGQLYHRLRRPASELARRIPLVENKYDENSKPPKFCSCVANADTMAAAYRAPLNGSTQYLNNSDVRSAISKAMDWWFDRDFTNPGCLDSGGLPACPCGTAGKSFQRSKHKLL